MGQTTSKRTTLTPSNLSKLSKSLSTWSTKSFHNGTQESLNSERFSVRSDNPNFKTLEGRPFLNIEGLEYGMPLDALEADRLNAFHFLSKTAAGGNFFAPTISILSKYDAKVLDVGCGTGILITEMAEEFPNAHFTGLDITEEYINQSTLPSNCTFLLQNALDGLPFQDNTFDYVTQRYTNGCWTNPQWVFIVAEMVRVLKPGGWIELWDTDIDIHRKGPRGRVVWDGLADYLKGRGIDPYVARRLQNFLAAHNIKKIHSSFFSLPFSWAGQLGKLHGQIQLKALQTSQGFVLETYGQTSFQEALMHALNEVAEYKQYMNYHQAWGCKPDPLGPHSRIASK